MSVAQIYGLLVCSDGGGFNRRTDLVPIQVTRIDLAQILENVSGRCIPKVDGVIGNLPEEYVSACINAIKSCESLFKNNPEALNKFRSCQFQIDIQLSHNSEDNPKGTIIEGRSHELAVAICVLASYLKLNIFDKTAVTGGLNSDSLEIEFVAKIIDKLDPFVSNPEKKQIKRFIIPNLKSLSQLTGASDENKSEVEKAYDYIKKIDGRKLAGRQISIILCNNLLELIKYVTPLVDFKKCIQDLRDLKIGNLEQFVFPGTPLIEFEDRIISVPSHLLLEIVKKRRWFDTEILKKKKQDNKNFFYKKFEKFEHKLIIRLYRIYNPYSKQNIIIEFIESHFRLSYVSVILFLISCLIYGVWWIMKIVSVLNS